MTFKKFILCGALIFNSIVYSQYCDGTHSEGDYQWITRVQLGNMDKSSANESYTFNETDKPAIGQSTSITITTHGLADDTVSLFIDWNQNGKFDDEGDLVATWPGAGEHTTTFTPPAGNPEGETRMRIRALYQQVDPCSPVAFTGGETEDYTVNVTWSKPLPLDLLTPNGGEALNVGQPYTITWDDNENVGNVTLTYQADFGEKVVIAENIPNTGSHVWTVPDISAFSVVVEVSAVSGQHSDASADVFRIITLALISPAGGEELEVNTVVPITWLVSSTIESLNFAYQLNEGAWVTVAENIPNSGTYNWTIPNVLSDSVKIRLVSPITGMQAVSETYFSFTGELAAAGQLPGEEHINLYLGSQKILQAAAGDISHVNIRNIKGELLKTLKAQTRMLIWDGRDHNVNPVSAGLYFFEFAGPLKSIQQKAFIFPGGM